MVSLARLKPLQRPCSQDKSNQGYLNISLHIVSQFPWRRCLVTLQHATTPPLFSVWQELLQLTSTTCSPSEEALEPSYLNPPPKLWPVVTRAVLCQNWESLKLVWVPLLAAWCCSVQCLGWVIKADQESWLSLAGSRLCKLTSPLSSQLHVVNKLLSFLAFSPLELFPPNWSVSLQAYPNFGPWLPRPADATGPANAVGLALVILVGRG